MDQVEDSMIEITSDDLPAFLYETGTIYDPDNEAAGLFQGFLLARVSTRLITFDSEHSIIFPGLSAYFYRSCFSDEPKRNWRNKEQGTSSQDHDYHRSDDFLCVFLDQFYNNIVSMFKDNAESSWVKETLDWWHE